MHRNFKYILADRVKESQPLLQVVLGPRQIGKTTACKQVYDEWQGPKHFCSADNISTPTGEWIYLNWEQARRQGTGTLLIIDEIQKITNWSEAVKVLFDEDRRLKNNLKVVVSGSASLYLQKGLVESLAGRFELIPARHWSLLESSTVFQWSLDQYLKFGGYPNPSAFINDPERWQTYIKDAVIETVISRDIFGLIRIDKPALFRQIVELCLSYPAQELSIEKMVGQLAERGSALTIRSYLQIIEKIFFIKLIYKFSPKPIVTKTSTPKLLPLCPALVHAFNDPSRISSQPEWRGRILESAIGAKLLETNAEVSYWRERNYEVDFVLKRENQILAIEVKSGRAKKSLGLKHFKQLYPRSIPILINQESAEKLLMSNLTGVELFEYIKKLN